MLRFSRAIVLSIGTGFVMGCVSDSTLAGPVGLPHAAAARGCAPNDGPAVEIYLSSTATETLEPSVPYLRIAVWQPLEALAGRAWSVGSGSTEGSASLHTTAMGSESATSGKVTVVSVSSDKRIEGILDVTFRNAGRIRGGFKATWISRTLLCG